MSSRLYFFELNEQIYSISIFTLHDFRFLHATTIDVSLVYVKIDKIDNVLYILIMREIDHISMANNHFILLKLFGDSSIRESDKKMTRHKQYYMYSF